MDGETEETALAGGVELAVLGIKLEDLSLDRLARGQARNQLDLTAEEVAPLLLLVRGGAGGRVALLDHEDGVLASGQRRDRDREAEVDIRKGGLQGDDRVLSDGGSRPEKEREQEGGGRAESHGWGCTRHLSRKAGACKRFFAGKRGPEETFALPLFFAGFQRTVRY